MENFDDPYVAAAFLRKHMSADEIAEKVGCHRGTVFRALKRERAVTPLIARSFRTVARRVWRREEKKRAQSRLA